LQSAAKFACSLFSLPPPRSPLPLRFLFAIRAQSKPDPLRTPRRWWQFSLMSARLIGPSFINARSIEIGYEREDIGKVGGRKTATRFYADARVFIKYDGCSLLKEGKHDLPRGEMLSHRKHRSCRDATCDCDYSHVSRFISLYERLQSWVIFAIFIICQEERIGFLIFGLKEEDATLYHPRHVILYNNEWNISENTLSCVH